MERASDTKHEFFAGAVFAMAGASRAHNLLATSTTALLWNALRGGPCEVYNSDQKVRILSTHQYVYPDVSVACDPRFEDDARDVLLNPSVIVEVLSDSAEAYDRGKKFEGYQTLESLRDYVMIAQHSVRIVHYAREPDGSWRMRVHGPGTAVALTACDAHLALDALYERVFPPAVPRSGE